MLAATPNADRRPFRLTPDPEFVYISPAQLDAYSRLFCAIHQRQNCLLLTGDPGTGKTLFLRRLRLDLENAGIAVCAFWNPVPSPSRLWQACCDRLALNVDSRQDVDIQSALLGRLKDNATSMAVLLDEADAIPDAVLASIEDFTSVCLGENAAVSIVLCGQRALATRLRDLAMTASIATRIRLGPLPRQEIEHFIRHHLRSQVEGVEYQFSTEAVERIVAHCGGLPAQINALCSGALLLAEIEGRTTVTPEMVDELAADKWMESDTTLANDVFSPAAEAELATVDAGLFGGLDEVSPPGFNAHAVQPLDVSAVDRESAYVTANGDGASASHAFLERSRSHTPDPASEGGLGTNDAANNAVTRELSSDSSSESLTDWLAHGKACGDSNTTDHDADAPTPEPPLLHGPDAGDFQPLDLGRLASGQFDEALTIDGPRPPRHAHNPHTAQGPLVDCDCAPQARSPRRRLVSTPLPWLVLLLLLIVPVGDMNTPNVHIKQAVTRIQAAISNVASRLDRLRQSWMRSGATIASKPADESIPLPIDDGIAALSQSREVNANAELTVEAQPAASAVSEIGVEVGDQLPRKYSRASAQPAETALQQEPARRVTNQGAGSAAMMADVPPSWTLMPIESPDSMPARIASAADVTPIPEVPVTSASKGSISPLHVRSASPIKGREDGAILLAIEPTNVRASEHEVEIVGVPRGASLSAGHLADRVWVVPVAELSNLALTPKQHSDDDIPLIVRLVRTSDRREIQTVEMTISVSAVADQPKLFVNVADGDQFTPIPIEVYTGLLDTDGSEQLSVTVSGLPDSVKLSAGRRIDNKWELTPAHLAGLFMTPMAGSPTELHLTIEAVATESSNGDQAIARRQLALNVIPANR